MKKLSDRQQPILISDVRKKITELQNIIDRLKKIPLVSGFATKKRILRNIEIQLIKAEYQAEIWENPFQGAM